MRLSGSPLHWGLGGQIIPTISNAWTLGTGERLLLPGELAKALKAEALARQQAEQKAEQERQRAERAEAEVADLKAQLREMGVNKRR